MSKTYTQIYAGAVATLDGTEKLAVDTASATEGTTTQAIANLVKDKTAVTGILKGNGTAVSAAGATDVTGQLLTNFSQGAGTVAATDSILQGINKLDGNDQTRKTFHGVTARAAVSPLPASLSSTTFTLACNTTPLTYYNNGVACTVSAAKTVTVSAGMNYIYFSDAAGTLTNYTTFQGLSAATGKVIVAQVWYDATLTYGIVYDERHAHDRDHAWHTWAHQTIGARYGGSGMDWSFSGTTNANTTFSITSGTLYDEDIAFTTGDQTTCLIWRQTGATTYAIVSASSTLPYLYSSGIQSVNASTYALSTTNSSNRHFNFYIYATTDVNKPFHVFVETTATTGGYTSVANAQAVAPPNLANHGLAPEYKLIRSIQVNGAGLIGGSVDYRTTSSIAGGATAASTSASVTYAPTTPDTASTVQGALDERPISTVATATDNTLARFDGATGKAIQTTGIVVSDTNEVSMAGTLITTKGTSAAFTPALTDAGGTFLMNNATNTVTIAAEGTVNFPIGTVLNFIQIGATQVVFSITTDTLNSGTDNSKKKLTGKGSAASLIKTASQTWWLVGDIAA